MEKQVSIAGNTFKIYSDYLSLKDLETYYEQTWTGYGQSIGNKTSKAIAQMKEQAESKWWQLMNKPDVQERPVTVETVEVKVKVTRVREHGGRKFR